MSRDERTAAPTPNPTIARLVKFAVNLSAIAPRSIQLARRAVPGPTRPRGGADYVDFARSLHEEIDLANPSHQVARWHLFMARWLIHGLPVFRPSRNLLAALLLTDSSSVDEFPWPFPAFFVEVPRELDWFVDTIHGTAAEPVERIFLHEFLQPAIPEDLAERIGGDFGGTPARTPEESERFLEINENGPRVRSFEGGAPCAGWFQRRFARGSSR